MISITKNTLTLRPARADKSARSIRAYSARAEFGPNLLVACYIIYAERPSQRMEEWIPYLESSAIRLSATFSFMNTLKPSHS